MLRKTRNRNLWKSSHKLRHCADSQGGRMRPVLGENPRRPWTVTPFHVKTLSNFDSKETGLQTPSGVMWGDLLIKIPPFTINFLRNYTNTLVCFKPSWKLSLKQLFPSPHCLSWERQKASSPGWRWEQFTGNKKTNSNSNNINDKNI